MPLAPHTISPKKVLKVLKRKAIRVLECYERIHVCRMMQELLPGGNIKLFAAVE